MLIKVREGEWIKNGILRAGGRDQPGPNILSKPELEFKLEDKLEPEPDLELPEYR